MTEHRRGITADTSISSFTFEDPLTSIPFLKPEDLKKMTIEMQAEVLSKYKKHVADVSNGATVITIDDGVRPMTLEDFKEHIDKVLQDAPAYDGEMKSKRIKTAEKNSVRYSPLPTTHSNSHNRSFVPPTSGVPLSQPPSAFSRHNAPTLPIPIVRANPVFNQFTSPPHPVVIPDMSVPLIPGFPNTGIFPILPTTHSIPPVFPQFCTTPFSVVPQNLSAPPRLLPSLSGISPLSMSHPGPHSKFNCSTFSLPPNAFPSNSAPPAIIPPLPPLTPELLLLLLLHFSSIPTDMANRP